MFGPHVTHERAAVPERLRAFLTLELPVAAVDGHVGLQVSPHGEPPPTLGTLVGLLPRVGQQVFGQDPRGAETPGTLAAAVRLGSRVLQLVLLQAGAARVLHRTLVARKLLHHHRRLLFLLLSIVIIIVVVVVFLVAVVCRHVEFEFGDKHATLGAHLAVVLVVAEVSVQLFLALKHLGALRTPEHDVAVRGAVVAVAARLVGESLATEAARRAVSELVLTQFCAGGEPLAARQAVELEL